MKSPWQFLVLAASLPLFASPASAIILLTDDFTVSQNYNDVSFENELRQGGTLRPSLYINYGTQHQVGNTGTDVGQPGGIANSNYALLAYNSSFQSVIDIGQNAIGPVTISFDLYLHGQNPSTDDTTWGAFTLRALGDAWPIAGAGEFGMLVRANGGLDAFENGSDGITPSNFDTPGTAPSDHWSLTFTNTAGTGSAFNGTGSKVAITNDTTLLGTLTLDQLKSTGLVVGFRNYNDRFMGVDNLSITTVPEPSAVLLLSAGAGLAGLVRRRRA